tara:strand:- start:2731 stop:3732 length:1002 start_codon:yes stop_codon:yes gene_type:complete
MPLPNSKQELADYVLRKLGAPVINVEIADIQLEDCIDDAVQLYQEYHFDGAERAYRLIKVDEKFLQRNNRKHQLMTAEDYVSTTSYSKGARVMYKVDNVVGERIYVKNDSDGAFEVGATFSTKFTLEEKLLEEQNITLTDHGKMGVKIPNDIISVVKIAKVDSFSQAGMWNYEYQYFLNNFDFFYGGMSGGGITSYYIQKSFVEHIEFLLNTSPAIRFNKHKNRLYLDMDMNRLKSSSNSGLRTYYLLAECYVITDPDIYGQVYSDSWLKSYAVSLAKMQWGANLKKYMNTELPGGVQLDGQTLYNEGKEEEIALRDELKNNNQLELDSIIWG